MTTVIPFIPSNIKAPTFPVTLDRSNFNVTLTWNISALRYYLNIYDKTKGTWIITIPLVSTPPARSVSSAIYDPFLNSVVVTFVDPLQWASPATGPVTKPGTIIKYTL
jgi:hypothetical protein